MGSGMGSSSNMSPVTGSIRRLDANLGLSLRAAIPTLLPDVSRLSNKQSSTGLSLSIVRMLVEAQGGKMGVETAVDAAGSIGIRLWVLLPMQDPSAPVRTMQSSDMSSRLAKRLRTARETRAELRRFAAVADLPDVRRSALEGLCQLDTAVDEMESAMTQARLPVQPSHLLVDAAKLPGADASGSFIEEVVGDSEQGNNNRDPGRSLSSPRATVDGTSQGANRRARLARNSAAAYAGARPPVQSVPRVLEPRSRAAVVLLTADPAEEAVVREAVKIGGFRCAVKAVLLSREAQRVLTSEFASQVGVQVTKSRRGKGHGGSMGKSTGSDDGRYNSTTTRDSVLGPSGDIIDADQVMLETGREVYRSVMSACALSCIVLVGNLTDPAASLGRLLRGSEGEREGEGLDDLPGSPSRPGGPGGSKPLGRLESRETGSSSGTELPASDKAPLFSIAGGIRQARKEAKEEQQVRQRQGAQAQTRE